MSETVTDSSASSEASAPAAPVVAPVESATSAPAVETPAAASPLPPAPAPEVTPPSPELPPIETPAPEIPQPSQPPQPVSPTNPQAVISSYLSRALEKIQFRKRAKLDKILALAKAKRSIKNDDVEKLLRVSDSTASRYLRQLVQEGKLRRSGSTKETVYETI